MEPLGLPRGCAPRVWLVGILCLVVALPVTSLVEAQIFIRGRINPDGAVDLSDAIFVLEYLFNQGAAPPCEKAADTNDDGALDISDGVHLLLFLFGGGVDLPPPYPDPGLDPTPDSLSCIDSPVGGHEDITAYSGPGVCVTCHRSEAEAIHGSVHYQWSGPTPGVPGVSGEGGKGGSGALAYNTYCGSTAASSWAVCGMCHAGAGRRPRSEVTDEELANVDCLVCHQEAYRRKPAGPFVEVAAVAEDGSDRMVEVPVIDETGLDLVPDEEAMSISALEAARTVHRPTRASCLRCHAYSGGGDNAKRGDLSSASESPAYSSDIHMSPDGMNLSCTGCHAVAGHRMLGRGVDLLPSDRSGRLECTECHQARPHGLTARDNHTAHVACQSCHIRAYARDVSTEMSRDWSVPVWEPELLGGQGGWKPTSERASNVKPVYRWFNGTSDIYVLGETIDADGDGDYVIAAPRGSVTEAAAKIYPMKVHRTNAARLDATGEMVPLATDAYFLGGSFADAVQTGMERTGMTGTWGEVEAVTYQTINHGVAPASLALSCNDCHVPLGGASARMNLQRDMGYALKAAMSTVCSQCHGNKSSKGFQWVHDKHVRDKRRDCSWCHRFSRPERGLRRP